MLHQVLAVILTTLRKSKNEIKKNIILETWIQRKGLPVFVLDLVLRNNQRRRAMGTKGKNKTFSDIFKNSWKIRLRSNFIEILLTFMRSCLPMPNFTKNKKKSPANISLITEVTPPTVT